MSHTCPTPGTDVSQLRDNIVPPFSSSISRFQTVQQPHHTVPHLAAALVALAFWVTDSLDIHTAGKYLHNLFAGIDHDR